MEFFWRAQEDFLAMQKEDASPALLGHLGEKMLFDMVELLKSILSSSALAATQYCHRCESQCRIHGPASLDACTTTLAIAGTMCTPWSSIGSRKKWMHHTCISFAVWVHLMLVRLPDIVIHECTPRFDVSVLVAFFGCILLHSIGCLLPIATGRASNTEAAVHCHDKQEEVPGIAAILSRWFRQLIFQEAIASWPSFLLFVRG